MPPRSSTVEQAEGEGLSLQSMIATKLRPSQNRSIGLRWARAFVRVVKKTVLICIHYPLPVAPRDIIEFFFFRQLPILDDQIPFKVNGSSQRQPSSKHQSAKMKNAAASC